MKPGTIVKNLNNETYGVVVYDPASCCAPWETPVIHDGETTFLGVPTADLEIHGEQKPIPDPSKCGAGKGADCCIFLTAGAEGFCCERFGPLHWQLVVKEMNAKRNPTELWPDCMNQS